MIKDYARRFRHANKRHNSKYFYGKRWLLLLVLLLIIPSAYCLYHKRHHALPAVAVIAAKPTVITHRVNLSSPDKLARHLHFIVVPKTQTLPSYYLLQLASYPTRLQANHYQHRLGKIGYNAKIYKVQTASRQWFRVVLGPYHCKMMAKQQQQRLMQDKIAAVVVQLP